MSDLCLYSHPASWRCYHGVWPRPFQPHFTDLDQSLSGSTSPLSHPARLTLGLQTPAIGSGRAYHFSPPLSRRRTEVPFSQTSNFQCVLHMELCGSHTPCCCRREGSSHNRPYLSWLPQEIMAREDPELIFSLNFWRQRGKLHFYLFKRRSRRRRNLKAAPLSTAAPPLRFSFQIILSGVQCSLAYFSQGCFAISAIHKIFPQRLVLPGACLPLAGTESLRIAQLRY